MTPKQTNLHARAILVNLSISAWSARKYDKKVTAEVNRSHGADADAGRYNKSLMPADAASYKALTQHVTAARERHYEQTLAWSDKGWRLLPIKNYQKYTDQVRQDQHTFDTLLAEFVRDYPTLREGARSKLNGMYSENDYPANIRGRFQMSLDTNPVPQAGDYRVELSEEEIEALTGKTEDRIKAAFAEAQNDAVKRLYEVLEKAYAKLAQPDAIFRDSLIENVRDVTAVLKNLNLADDPKLEKFRRQAELLATASEPQTLRDVADVRVQTANDAQSILDKMKATYGANLFA